MDDTVEVTGLVSFSAPAGEYDRRLVLLTRELGRITVFAVGARRPTCPYIAACRTFTFAKFTLSQGRSAYRIKAAQIVESFDELSQDFDAVSYGTYLLELAGYFSEENVEMPDTVNLIYMSLKALLKPAIPNKLVRCVFELRILQINGEAPNVFECVYCGKPIKDGFFEIKKHGIACRECKLDEYATYVSHAAAVSMQYILTAPITKLYTFSVTEDVLRTLCECMERYYRHYVGHKFKSLEMLDIS